MITRPRGLSYHTVICNMNNSFVIILVLFSSTVFGQSKMHECSEHSHFLLIESAGFEHVTHRPLLNGKIVIKELEKAMWFIEEVSCSEKGFEITASHKQYNEPTKKTFSVTIISNDKYEIK